MPRVSSGAVRMAGVGVAGMVMPGVTRPVVVVVRVAGVGRVVVARRRLAVIVAVVVRTHRRTLGAVARESQKPG